MLFRHKYNKILQICERYISPGAYLSLSWGKDSIFLLYILREINLNIKAVYLNSGYALPDTYRIRDELLDKWDINYTEISQELDYIELCEAVGLPHERSESDQNRAVTKIKKDVLDR